MNKTIKNLSLAAFALIGLAMMTVSCNRDEINALNDRVTKVESALTELQSQITEGSVITDVTSTENGVTVTLSDGSSFTLTNGADGANGADGSVVSIGENGNWFIDGVDTGMPSRGEKGQDGADAPTIYYYPGEDGTFVKVTVAADGSKTEEPTEISYLVAGVVTAVWDTENGELVLYNVEGAENGKVVISLDGTLKSLAFVPEVIKDGYGLLQALYLDREVKPGEYQFLTSNKVQALYRVNPANADLEGVEFSFIGRKVEVATRAAGDDADVFSGVLVDSEDGLLFDINANEILDLKADEAYLVALKASFDEEEIVSDYARYEQDYIDADDVLLVNRHSYDKEVPVIENFYYPADEKDMPALSATPHMTITYGKELNIKDSVVAYAPGRYNKSLEDLGFDNVEYRISLPAEYVEDQTNVNQNACVNLSEDGVMTVKEGTSNVGKTPVVKADAYVMVDGKEDVIATAYIKIEVVAEDVSDEPEEPRSLIELDFGTIEYSELSATVQKEYSKTLTATEFNSKVLDVLGLTPEEFAGTYESGFGYLTEDDEAAWNENGVILNNVKDLPSMTLDWTAGNTYTFSLTNAVKYGEGPVDIALTIAPKTGKTAPVIVMHVKFNIVHDLDACWPAFDPSYVVNNEAKVKGVMENGVWVLRAALSEHFEDAAEAADIEFSLPKLNDKGEVDEKNGKAQEGAALSGNDVNATISCSLELSSDRTYVVMMTRKHDNGQEHSKLYKVTFMVPFQTSVEPVVLTDSREAVSADIAKGIILKENAGTEVVYKDGKVVDKNSYGFTDSSFQITTALAKDQPAVEELDITGNTVTWKNEGTLLRAPKEVNLVVSVKIAGIYVSETPVTVTINPAE